MKGQISIYDAIARAPRFNGPDLVEADHARLTGQLERIVRLMRDGRIISGSDDRDVSERNAAVVGNGARVVGE